MYTEKLNELKTLIEQAKQKYPNNDCTTGKFGLFGRYKGGLWISSCEQPLRTAIINYKKATEDVGRSSFKTEDVEKDFNNKSQIVNTSIQQLKDAEGLPVRLGGKRRRRSTKRGRRKSLRRRKTVRK
jgi:hypothetical protein